MTQQEIFNFHKVENISWSDFIESSENYDAIACLMKWPAWTRNGVILFGGAGTGKTHLAALWAQTANAVYILNEALNHDPRDLFAADCNFVIDNFDNFLDLSYGRQDWIFHFFNIAHEKNRYFLILSKSNPISWDIELNDLKSRVLALSAVEIQNPGDELLFKIAKKIMRDLELTVPDEVLSHLLYVIDRNVASVAKVLRTLDKLSLQQKKSITLSFAKKYLNREERIKSPNFSGELQM
ncbi:MAG: hypothetical protein LBP41_00505 [Holosporaceae bacterium]|jgi:chromosomal replication initiation ATPase DnaA|nr:hypothetical protein [Holosporaceae bacterium]